MTALNIQRLEKPKICRASMNSALENGGGVLCQDLVSAGTLKILMHLARLKDSDTSEHLERMAHTSFSIGRQMGLSELSCEAIRLAAPLHDIGKLGVPDSILKKAGALDDVELKIMRRHPIIGYEILSNNGSFVLDLAAEISLAHHEKWDGSGYPFGLKGDEIPISGQIVGVSDVYDALSSARPYKEAWPQEKVIAHMRASVGKHFSEEVVDALLRHVQAQT